MKKGVPYYADRALHNICHEQSNERSLQQVEGTASKQLEIRNIANRILDFATDHGTSFGMIEVVFAERPWKRLKDLLIQCPTKVTFRNFIPEEDDIDQHSLLVSHMLVVTNWSNDIKVFKATIENENIHLMLYSPMKKPKI
jgi:hypothetical protein